MLSSWLKLGSFFLSLCVHCCVSSFFLFVNALGFIYSHFLNYFGSKVRIDCERHAVVITGCDSGFGEMTSRQLQRLGFHVITVCITPEGAQRLTGIVALSIVGDVTKEKDIANLVTQVEDYMVAKKVKLWGVVCNAGIGNSGAVDWISTLTFRKVLEVNFFGVVNVTKALLPLLKRNKGSRIVNLSSVAGFVSAPMMAAYDASKHAVEGYAKALRAEMKPWNIHVSNVNPGFMRTPIVLNGPATIIQEWDKVPKELRAHYGELFPPPDAVNSLLEDPQLVVEDIVRALTDSCPQMWYFPGNQATYFFRHLTNMNGPVLDAIAFMTRVSPIEPQPRPEVLAELQA